MSQTDTAADGTSTDSARPSSVRDEASTRRTRDTLRLSPLLVLCAAVTLLIGGTTLQYIEYKFVSASGESLALAAVSIADKLDRQLTERYGDVQMLAESRLFRERNVAAMTEYMHRMAEAYPVYDWIGVADATGRIIAATDAARLGEDQRDQEWFRAARKQGGTYIQEPQPSPDAPTERDMVLAAAIRDQAGEVLGVVAAQVSLAVMEDIFTRTVTALQAQWGTGTRVEYQFINREGELLADSLLREEGRKNLKLIGLPSAQLFDAAPPGFVEERHRRRQTDVVTGYAMTKGIGERPALQWGVLVRVDRSDLLAPIRVTVVKIGLVGMGLLVPLGGGLVWSSRRLRDALAKAVEEQGRAREAEHEFRCLVDSAPDALIIADGAGRIILCNQQAEALFGYSAHELAGQLVELLVPDRFRSGHREHRACFAQAPAVRPMGAGYELAARRHDGTEFPVQISLSHMETSEGRFAIAAIRDITMQKRNERELQAAKGAAEAGIKAKSEFLATMSHEIRTPMNGIIGMTGLLLDTALTAEQREYAETVRASGGALLGIINDILDFSKVEAGKLDLETVDFDLRVLVEDVGMLLAERAHSKGLELASLVQAPVPTGMRGDPGRIRQILTNLVGNAIKFTERGEIIVNVSVADSTDGEGPPYVNVRFDVTDTGIGIAPEQCERIFERFAQADSSMSRRFGGTGLGLAICKMLTQLMRGRIGVESVPGKGTTFWFIIPLQQQARVQPAQVVPSRSLQGHRVLIVDDHAVNRRILEHQLDTHGILRESADSGGQALAALKRFAARGTPFDLAILDLKMPEMDGLELARRIKADASLSNTHLVLLTSLGRRGDAKLAQEAGIAAYLTKPVRQAQLIECLSLVMATTERTAVQADNQPAPMITRHSLSEAQAHRTPRVLVVEDNPVNQKVAARMLEKLGCRVDVAANGREAVEGLARIPYALVFMDCQMPEMDGFEATKRIREEESRQQSMVNGQSRGENAAHPSAPMTNDPVPMTASRIPIIAMTANAMAEDRARCLASGMDDFVSKPVQMKELATMVNRWLPNQKFEGRLMQLPAA